MHANVRCIICHDKGLTETESESHKLIELTNTKFYVIIVMHSVQTGLLQHRYNAKSIT